jgi:signal transduction histidine kinase/HPt (histidine-containing phosphotransfer) domain-containing protein
MTDNTDMANSPSGAASPIAVRLERMRQAYVAELPRRLLAVRAAVAQLLEAGTQVGAQSERMAPLTALTQLVHKLAGSGTTFGCDRISDAARPFELLLQSFGEAPLTPVQRAEIELHMAQLEDALTRLHEPRPSGRWDAAGAPADAAPGPGVPNEPARAGKRIFVVEDDADLAAQIAATLEHHGYSVRGFQSLAGLRDAMLAEPPLAILMDLMLPEGNLAGALAIPDLQRLCHASIPVIAISVRSDLEARLAAVRAGCARYMSKPLDTGVLLRWLDELTLSQPLDPYRILIVDDDAALAQMYQGEIEARGMRAAVATDPRRVPAAMQSAQPELVLMDVNMAYCDGLELAATIRQQDEFSGVPIVFLSTDAGLDRRLAAMHLGGDDFLSKPIEGWRLASAVHARVHRAREQRQARTRLLEAKLVAESANLAKSRFLATMSHEIRTPLNGVLGMAQLLLEPGLPDAERVRFTKTILSSGQMLLTLLNDILDLSKVEAGKIELSDEAFDPQLLCREVVALFEPTALTKKLHLGAAWRGTPGRLYRCDPLRLRQMLFNLVANAIKFTATGFVRIEAREIEIDSGGRALLEFAVSDSGIGIAPERQSALFQAFTQAENSIHRDYGGTGLGLSIVSRLARLMGGTVGLQSTPGSGSKFWFRVRCGAPAPAGVDEADSAGATAAGTGRAAPPRVVLAEDNPVNSMVIQQFLAKLGIDAECVADGQAAVQAATQGRRPALMLMDIQMPVMDGVQATRLIRAWEKESAQRGIPIVAITANIYSENRDACFAAGVNAFLPKPISLKDLKATVAQWMVADGST